MKENNGSAAALRCSCFSHKPSKLPRFDGRAKLLSFVFYPIEHLADIAVLGGTLGKLNCAFTRRIVRDEAERVECRRIVALAAVFFRSFGNDGGGCSPTRPPPTSTIGCGGGGDGGGGGRLGLDGIVVD